MVLIDTDVLLLAFAFQHDSRQEVNRAVLELVSDASPAITVYNLMELLGQLSFNLAPARLEQWRTWLVDAYHLTVIWPRADKVLNSTNFYRQEIFERPFAKMRSVRMGFLDSLILGLVEQTPNVDCFVTWNARHFKEKSSLIVYTPEEYLRAS